MSASLEIARAARRRGLRSKFLATGQAGLMISGEGVTLDAVRVDFAAGAVEQLVMNAGGDRDLLVVEGQGSLVHPGSTATLPLIRGTQPTHLVLVHRAGQTSIYRQPHIDIPPLPDIIQLYETVARAGGMLHPSKVAAIALNTARYDEERARDAIAAVEDETGLPCTDVVRFGADRILDGILDRTLGEASA
ncbi:NAD-dependent epimerase/dehydratase family protein, partial [Oscillatoriales cyanobacterium LEGE 11467]